MEFESIWTQGSSTKEKPQDFPGGPVVKTSPSNAGGMDLIPGQVAKSPHALWPKKPKHKTGTTLKQIYRLKTLKMVHIKKNYLLKKKRRRKPLPPHPQIFSLDSPSLTAKTHYPLPLPKSTTVDYCCQYINSSKLGLRLQLRTPSEKNLRYFK